MNGDVVDTGESVEGTDRQKAGPAYPWYDSRWLTRYVRARDVIRRVRPDRLDEFETTLAPLRTRRDFETVAIERVFDRAVMDEIERVIAGVSPSEYELHEAKSFGRFVVHNHPFFTALQRQIVDLVSDAVGERVEAKYNFLSLYSALGVCPLHMDSPQSKWTLDLCIRQSTEWPIHFSQVLPWPDDPSEWAVEDWETRIRQSPSVAFTTHVLKPGQAVVFSGSSQWHYRDAIASAQSRQFCDLLFFHFVPEGFVDLVEPSQWARHFGIPELDSVTR